MHFCEHVATRWWPEHANHLGNLGGNYIRNADCGVPCCGRGVLRGGVKRGDTPEADAVYGTARGDGTIKLPVLAALTGNGGDACAGGSSSN